MAYQKKTWKDRLSEYPNRRTLTDTTTGTTQTVTVARAEGEVAETGDAFSEENMNAMETRIDNAFSDKVLTKYGTCSTEGATLAKEATLLNKDDWKLVNGALVCIQFTNAVPASATLNVEDTGAKAIYYQSAALVANIIRAGNTGTFIYDGTNYNLVSIDTVGEAASDYPELSNKPSINNVELVGNKTASDLGLATISVIAGTIPNGCGLSISNLV